MQDKADKVYNKNGLHMLRQKAEKYLRVEKTTMGVCQYLNRCLLRKYMDIAKNTGIMELRPKDDGGDPHNPINKRLKGLFFMAEHDIPPFSYFGNTRLKIPIELLMTNESNLYFSDFYCMSIRHYVILVVTETGSYADQFCSNYLSRLDICRNPFLCHVGSHWEVVCGLDGGLEIFYTEAINMSQVLSKGAEMSSCDCRGESKGGKSKRWGCDTCWFRSKGKWLTYKPSRSSSSTVEDEPPTKKLKLSDTTTPEEKISNKAWMRIYNRFQSFKVLLYLRYFPSKLEVC